MFFSTDCTALLLSTPEKAFSSTWTLNKQISRYSEANANNLEQISFLRLGPKMKLYQTEPVQLSFVTFSLLFSGSRYYLLQQGNAAQHPSLSQFLFSGEKSSFKPSIQESLYIQRVWRLKGMSSFWHHLTLSDCHSFSAAICWVPCHTVDVTS